MAAGALGAGLAAMTFGVPAAGTAMAAPSGPLCTYATQLGAQFDSVSSLPSGPTHVTGIAMSPTTPGYWITTDQGETFTCDMTSGFGSWTIPGAPGPKSPVVGQAGSAGGLYLVTASGVVGAFGAAAVHGSIAPGTRLEAPIVGMATDQVTGGYWLVAADGGVFSFDAPFFGSMGGRPLNAPIVGMAADPSGNGYWLVASDGGVFSFGGAGYEGSEVGVVSGTGGTKTVGIAASSDRGYWLVSGNGAVGAFGDAPSFGSVAGMNLNAPVVAIAASAAGQGYWELAGDGGVFSFGDAAFEGSAA